MGFYIVKNFVQEGKALDLGAEPTVLYKTLLSSALSIN